MLIVILVVDAILFGGAGRLDWPAAWALTLLFFLFLVLMLSWGLKNARALLEERIRPAGEVRSWDKIVLKIYNVLRFAVLFIAALDAGRFRWSVMPGSFQVFAAAVFVALGLIVWRTMCANSYLSSRARIQSDRNQKVVTTGPYQYVRHPMYVAIILLNPCLALILGSWWAIIPAALICPVYMIRTWLEDRMLQDELAGYRDYASRVRYRLVPGVW